ncbi:MAG: hypothetical protein KC766_38870 [Myxococcales bacterium]|nr:hypothetical protein [Myxococcales bacterium]
MVWQLPRTQRLTRRLGSTLALTLVACLLTACEKDPPPAPAKPAPSDAPSGPCANGKSDDPPNSEFKPAQNAFHEKEYSRSKQLLADLAKRYPSSASVRVWQGDAALFDSKTPLTEAADQGLVFYQQALALQEKGCRLPDYERYYLRMGFGYAYLRKKDGKRALVHLKAAEEEFKNSSGLYYNIARAYCREDNVDQCVAYFEKTLVNAKALKKPDFLRSHYSLASWVSRSRTQSEFVKLRRDKRYRELLAKYKGD